MTELELYKFCKDKEVDWRRDELILWIPFSDVDDFANMLGYNYLSEGGIDVVLLNDCIALNLVYICENFDINPENILKKTE